MTSICYKDNVLAADSWLGTDYRDFYADKIRIIEYDGMDALYVFTGYECDDSVFEQWLTDGCDASHWPFKQKTGTGIVITNSDAMWWNLIDKGKGHHIPLKSIDCMSWGTGIDFTTGAMRAGLSAAEAIQLAIKSEFDSIGGDIVSYDVVSHDMVRYKMQPLKWKRER